MFGTVGIVNAVLAPDPGRMRVDFRAIHHQFFKTSEEHFPEIAFAGWKRTAVGQRLHARPGKGKLDGPATIDGGAVIDFAIDADG